MPRPQAQSLVALFCSFLLAAPEAAPASQEKHDAPSRAAYGKLPLHFEANHGQADSQAQFLARGPGYSFFLTPTEAVMELRQPDAPEMAPPRIRAERTGRAGATTRTLRMQFAGANAQPRMLGLEALPGKVNYLCGNDEAQWQRGISMFARVQYEQLYPGVDLLCYGNQGQLEYDFIIAPGANPDAISLYFEGVDQLEVDGQGDLVLHAAGGRLRQHKPVLYQTIQSARKEISGGYLLRQNHTVQFQVGNYDRAQPLIIDPVLSYSTYLGGGRLDIGWDIAVDAAGNAYLAGETISLLPNLVTPGAFQTNYAGGFSDHTNQIGGDAFVAKLDPTGSNLVYLTYLGGSGDDAALGITVDGAGQACVTGYTDSTNFPTRNPIQSGIHGTPDALFGFFPEDAFVAKLDSSGSSLLYSTYLGGNGVDEGLDIAVDAAGAIYVTGFTQSTNFPLNFSTNITYTTNGATVSTNIIATPRGLQTLLNTHTNNFGVTFFADAFVAKIDPQQPGSNALIYSTYLGSGNTDQGSGIAVDAQGNAYVAGVMDLLGRRDIFGNILYDAFVVKLDPTGSSLLYGQLLHGSSNDLAFRIAVDAAGSAYVTGSTTSGDFPATPNGLNSGGVFKSMDGGASWSPSSAGLTRSFIRSLAIDPAAPSTLYAGTAGGVFKSMDGGGSWSNNASALSFVVISNSITATDLFTTNSGVVSTNVIFLTNALPNPVTFWFTSFDTLSFDLVTTIAIDPTDPSRLYAGTAGGGAFASQPVFLLSITNVQGTFTNAQSIWFPIPGTNGILINPNVNAVLVDPLMPQTLYAGTSGGLFKSTNAGATWFGAGLGFPVVKALAMASDASVLYVGSSGGIARSSNRGTNWTGVDNGLANLSVNALVLNPAAPATVYAGTGGGVFKTVNGGTNWVRATNGLSSLIVNALAIDPSAPATIYAGTTNGLFKTTDAGASWGLITNGLTATNVASLAIDPGSPNTIYAGTGTTNSFRGVNCFVTKISSDGSSLDYSTVLGGDGNDTGWDIAVGPGGEAYVVGAATSNNFPVVQAPSPRQATNSGGFDAFVLELDPTGSALVYSFYLGGNGDDFAHGIGLDAAGNSYIIGQTASTTFPTVGPLQGTNSGGVSDVFVTKILAQPPLAKLLTTRSGNNLVLSWRAPPAAFILEVNNNGLRPGDWAPFPQTPAVNNGLNTVAVGLSGGHQTFRLKRQY